MIAITEPSGASRSAFATAARWLAGQILLISGIALAFSAGLVLVFDQRIGPTLVYCFAISFSCTVFITLARISAARWVHRHAPASAGRSNWPGWPLMMACLLVGTLLGYSLGNEIGNWVTGYSSPALLGINLRRAISMMLISLLPGLALTFYFFGRGRLDAAEARAQTAQRLAAEAHLRLLESQLEPHMLFNTLANLRVLISIDPPRAQAMLDQLIAFLRATLSASRSGPHPLREEFTRIGDYLALMQVRMGLRLRPQLLLPADLAEQPMPPLLLQPLVENAIKHGLEPAVDGGELRVSASIDAGQLLLEVFNTGAALVTSAAADGSQFGLRQVRERLAAQYGPSASLQIGPAPGNGTLVSIRLPLA